MCIATGLTYGGGSGSSDGYVLADSEAAALRMPSINYPGGRVPVEVVKACVGGKIDSQIVKVENGTMALADVLNFMKSADKIHQATEGDGQVQRRFSVVK